MKKIIMTACLTVLGAACFSAPFTVNRIFANNMVLQREKEIPVWGTAAPGTEITVSFKGTNGKTWTTSAISSMPKL